MWDEIRQWPSYPSLDTQCKLHQLDVFVHQLPVGPFSAPFSSLEGSGEQFWEWRVDKRIGVDEPRLQQMDDDDDDDDGEDDASSVPSVYGEDDASSMSSLW